MLSSEIDALMNSRDQYLHDKDVYDFAKAVVHQELWEPSEELSATLPFQELIEVTRDVSELVWLGLKRAASRREFVKQWNALNPDVTISRRNAAFVAELIGD